MIVDVIILQKLFPPPFWSHCQSQFYEIMKYLVLENCATAKGLSMCRIAISRIMACLNTVLDTTQAADNGVSARPFHVYVFPMQVYTCI